MELIAILQIYSFFIYSALAMFFPRIVEYRVFVLLVSIFATLGILRLLIKNHKLSLRTWQIFTVSFFMAILFYFTQFLYGYSNSNHNSYLLVFIAQTMPALLLGSLLAREEGWTERFSKTVPYISLVFTILAIILIINPNSYGYTNLIESARGLNYQNISYMAFYASSLALYSALFLDNKMILTAKITNYIIVFANLFICLTSGGRGGFVAFVVVDFIIIFVGNYKKLSANQMIKSFLGFLLLVALSVAVFSFTGNSRLGSIGFDRIIDFFQRGSVVDRQRTLIYANAIQTFERAPIFGHGIGSVFYESLLYSHNFFLDALIETGVVGTAAFTAIIVITIRHGWRLYKYDRKYIIWLILFFQGFASSIFSSYYLDQIPMYWSMAYIITKYNSQKKNIADFEGNKYDDTNYSSQIIR